MSTTRDQDWTKKYCPQKSVPLYHVFLDMVRYIIYGHSVNNDLNKEDAVNQLALSTQHQVDSKDNGQNAQKINQYLSFIKANFTTGEPVDVRSWFQHLGQQKQTDHYELSINLYKSIPDQQGLQSKTLCQLTKRNKAPLTKKF